MVRYWVIVPGFLLLAVVFSLVSSEEDLYRVLQVSRSASPREIKSSYRKLAKKWHPDKNQAPDAKDKFIHINRAYEILSNKEKRHHYDTTGSVEETLHGSHQSSHDGFTVFQSGNGFQFHFRFPGGGGSTRKDDSITAGMFFDQVLPKSDRTPYLIYFYHEFCFECMGVDNVWAELKRDLKPLGVGQGTVHTSFQPRVAQYCSVSRVPSIVGVVSGRVLHFNGHQYNSRSIKNFLKSILPANVITKLTSSNVDSFLSNAILRNRPRVVLFSRAPSPSLTYLLTALYLRKTLDFAYAPVGRGERDVALCTRFQVEEGERKLLVFKEDRAPVLVETITELSRRLLLDLLEDVTLYLQRISSPMMFDTICHLERPCALLVVEGTSQYNDSKAVAFREAAKKGGGSLSFSYIDASLQEDFLSTFKWSRTAESCDDGTTARKIILLKRLSSSVVKFKWIDQFCEQSLDDLPSHFSTIGFKITQMEKKILDEEAPVWYERLWIKLEEYYFSFTSATNMQSLTPMISLVFTGLMVCMMAALTGMRREEEEEEDRTKQRRQDHRKKLEKPEQTKSSRSSTCIYPLNQQNYATITDNPTKGMVTLVIFTDTSTTKHRDELLAAYENILRKHHYSNLQYFFLCYRSQSKWFENIMSCSSQLPQEEINMRVRACASGGVATAVCLIGTKKQFLLYPENLGLVCELNRQGMEGDTEGVSGGSSEIGGLKKNKNPGQKKDVGETLGNIFGYESESEEDEDRFKFNGFSSNSTHKRHSAHKSGPNSSSHKSNPSFEDLSLRHELEEPSIRQHLRQIEQVDATFENWLERLADGSLQRYTLEVWPEWT